MSEYYVIDASGTKLYWTQGPYLSVPHNDGDLAVFTTEEKSNADIISGMMNWAWCQGGKATREAIRKALDGPGT